jgi:Tfp pilus assembly protein PilN
MKEIDFLPEWYKSHKRRRLSYRTQYIALACTFGVMMMWNFVSLNSVSNATAKLAQMASEQSKAQITSKEFTRIKNELADLHKKVNILGEIDSRIDVANLLAEMSFLIDERIVLSKVEFISEKFIDKQPKTNTGAAVRVVGVEPDRLRGLPLGDVLFKVLISGIAADASDVASLVRRLEDSPYFCKVCPSISRIKTMQITNNTVKISEAGAKKALNANDYRVSEFEISCYLANYRQEKL